MCTIANASIRNLPRDDRQAASLSYECQKFRERGQEQGSCEARVVGEIEQFLAPGSAREAVAEPQAEAGDDVVGVGLVQDADVVEADFFQDASQHAGGEVLQVAGEFESAPVAAEDEAFPAGEVGDGKDQLAPLGEDAMDFGERLFRVVQMFQHHQGEHGVEPIGIEPGGFERSRMDVKPALPRCLCGRFRDFDSFGVPAALAEFFQETARTASDIECRAGSGNVLGKIKRPIVHQPVVERFQSGNPLRPAAEIPGALGLFGRIVRTDCWFAGLLFRGLVSRLIGSVMSGITFRDVGQRRAGIQIDVSARGAPHDGEISRNMIERIASHEEQLVFAAPAQGAGDRFQFQR